MPNTPLIIKTVIAVVFGSGVISFMGYGIVNNDIRNTGQHIEIRKEVAIGDEKNEEKIDEVKEIVTDIRLEQKEMIVTQRMILDEIKR